MTKITFILIASIFCTTYNYAQKDKAIAYINLYKDIAITEMQRSGVPAAITLAQGMLESGYGESELAVKSNNHFGIKCKENWTGEKVYHDDDAKQECFRVYATVAESYKDHSDFLKSRPWYASLFELDATDYEGWANGLKKAGYATEKDYANRLIKIITDYNLQQYNINALNSNTEQSQQISIEYSSAKTNETIDSIDSSVSEIKNTDTIIRNFREAELQEIKLDTNNIIAINEPTNIIEKKESMYPEGIFNINHSKVIYAKEGSSLLAIANQYNISLSKLFSFNDMKELDILNQDTLLFIEPKLKKGANEIHITQQGETLNSIAQKEGVQLNSLVQYNQITADKILNKNEKIYLRPQQSKKQK